METNKKTNIIIADDHSIFLEGITALISSNTINVIANCKNGQEVLDVLKTQKPDLVISDINMPIMDGITLTKKIKKLYPDIKIMMLSMYEEKYIINKALKGGADGYISKNSGKEEILNAIEDCMKGKKYISNTQSKFIQSNIKSNDKELRDITLTNREKQILKLITEEVSNSDIALKLDISKRTVETHKKNLILKLGVTSTVGLIKIAMKNKLFTIKNK
ncbi:response regulator transcription factor [Flavobacteriales bacterium]|nr:response regulator transcription factor [Flavobacteriales bacterium]MDC3305594.1 response regulator transcription factor [Flavobacteriales bacterium]